MFVFIDILLLKETKQGILRRGKRGLLSRTGFCPNPRKNFQIKDNRLNFYGTGYLLPPSDASSRDACLENECSYDSQCEGDQRCCKNVCGASVCTQAIRDPHPCSLFTCPEQKICKLQRVRCILPDCPDLYAVPRPICVPARLVPEKRGSVKSGKSTINTPESYIYPEKSFFRQSQTRRSEVPVEQAGPEALFYVFPEKPFYHPPQ